MGEACGGVVADVGAELLELVDELIDGALAHAGDAVEDVFGVAEGEHGGEEADGGAGVAAVDGGGRAGGE